MSREVIVRMDDANQIVIDPKAVCEELGFVVLDPEAPDEAKAKFRESFVDICLIGPNNFDAALTRVHEFGWSLFRDLDEAREAIRVENPGVIELDQSKDPDPYGNHGIPLTDRLAAMGWPASSPLVLERTEAVRLEDLL